MKKYIIENYKIIGILILLAFLSAAIFHNDGTGSTKNSKTYDELFVCSMHPWEASEGPGDCPICGMELSEVHGHKAGTALPDEADLRIRNRLHTEQGYNPVHEEILDIEDLAVFLKISVTEVVNLLSELPSFEVGGRIRFRKDRIIEWIMNQEQKMTRDRNLASLPAHKNIIQLIWNQRPLSQINSQAWKRQSPFYPCS